MPIMPAFFTFEDRYPGGCAQTATPGNPFHPMHEKFVYTCKACMDAYGVISDFRDTDDYRYKWLSNFYQRPIVFRDGTWRSTENAYQAVKTLDKERRKDFLDVTPAEAKRMGRKLELRPDWELIKFDAMTHILRAKFNQHSDLEQKLLDTGSMQLIEGNNWNDRIWGVDVKNGGENNLGRTLMRIRDELSHKRLLEQI